MDGYHIETAYFLCISIVTSPHQLLHAMYVSEPVDLKIYPLSIFIPYDLVLRNEISTKELNLSFLTSLL